jgi:integrase
MNVEPYDDQDGYRCWLSLTELETLHEQYDDTARRIAISLGGYCGLRSKEITNVTPDDLRDTEAGMMLRVWQSKGSKLRETPVPPHLATQIQTIGDVRSEPSDAPIVDVSTRTLRRWMDDVTEQLAAFDDQDDMWEFVGFHDLRRTWANQMRSADVDPMLVCEWGGWNDLETFLEHYKGVMTPEGQLREREKVDWL